MYGKILPALVAGLLFGTCAVALAQTATAHRTAPHRTMQPHRHMYMQAGRTNPRRYDPYAGTVWEGVVPYGSRGMPDPYAGTPFQGVAPY